MSRDIDKLVAQQMGYQDFIWDQLWTDNPRLYALPPTSRRHKKYHHFVANYSTEKDAAREVLSYMKRHGYKIRFGAHEGIWDCQLNVGNRTAIGSGPSGPMAVCQAFLLLRGISS